MKFTLFVFPKRPEKSPVISTDHPVCHTVDPANLVAGSFLQLMPTYPIKLVCESRPLSDQHPSLKQGHTDDKVNWTWQGDGYDCNTLTVEHDCVTTVTTQCMHAKTGLHLGLENN